MTNDNTYMMITVTYSVELNERDVQRIREQLKINPSLRAFNTMRDYLKDRIEGLVVLELQKGYDENLDMRCEQKYIEFHSY